MNKPKNITAIIDGDPVQVLRGQTVLEAALKTGIYIPTLCYLKNLKSYGGCRLCIVEIKGRKGYPTACTTPIEPGMEIQTKTARLQQLRREILEFTLSEHPYTCLVCKDQKECTDFMYTTRKSGTVTGCNFCTSNGDCELQDLIDYLDLRDVRFPISYRAIPPDKMNPFYDLDYNLCILCGRCVRICSEERNSHVLAFVQRGNSTIVGTAFNESQIDAGCEFCGACVDVCPTGSISEKIGKWAGLPDRSLETTCTLCSLGCTMNVNTRKGRMVNIGPRPGQRTDPRQLCIRGKFLPGDLIQHPERIVTPMVKRNGKWAEVDWDEALSFTAGVLKESREGQFGMICSAQDTLEENYILQKFARKVMYSNNIDLFSSYPDREMAKKVTSLVHNGSRSAFTVIGSADTCLILGANASVSHPLLENRIRKAFQKGRKILYAGSRTTRTSNFASLEIRYAPGEEYHFLYVLLAGLAMANEALLPAGIADRFKKADLAKAMERCAVKQKDLEPFISSMAGSRNLCILVSDSYLRTESANDVIQALVNFSFLTSKQTRCHILIPSFEGNLIAGSQMGVHPDLLPGFDEVKDKTVLRKWNRHWKTRLSPAKGLLFGEMLDQHAGDGISALMVAGDIPSITRPGKLPFLIQMNMFRTGLTEQADVFLPVTGFLETEGHTMTMEGKVKMLRRTLVPPGKTRSIPWILNALAAKMDEQGFQGNSAGKIWKEITSLKIIQAGAGAHEKPIFQSIRPRRATGKRNTASDLQTYDHFRYRGNELTALIPDLGQVTEALITDKAAYGKDR